MHTHHQRLSEDCVACTIVWCASCTKLHAQHSKAGVSSVTDVTLSYKRYYTAPLVLLPALRTDFKLFKDSSKTA
jgi:hypothetical protein